MASSTSTQLLTACANGELATVQTLLSSSSSSFSSTTSALNVNHVDDQGRSSLHLVARQPNRAGIAQLLLCHPLIDVNLQSHEGWTPLHAACHFGLVDDTIKLLMIHPRLDVTRKNKAGYTVLETAVDGEKLEIVKLLFLHRGLASGVHPGDWARLASNPRSAKLKSAELTQLVADFAADPAKTRRDLRIQAKWDWMKGGEIKEQELDERWMDLYRASWENNVSLAQRVLQTSWEAEERAGLVQKFSPNAVTSLFEGKGDFPTLVACIKGNAEVLRVLTRDDRIKVTGYNRAVVNTLLASFAHPEKMVEMVSLILSSRGPQYSAVDLKSAENDIKNRNDLPAKETLKLLRSPQPLAVPAPSSAVSAPPSRPSFVAPQLSTSNSAPQLFVSASQPSSTASQPSQSSSAEHRVRELEDENLILKGILSDNENEYKRVQGDLTYVESQNKEILQENATLKAKVQELLAKIQELSVKSTVVSRESESERQTLNRDLTQARDKATLLTVQLQKAHLDLEALKSQAPVPVPTQSLFRAQFSPALLSQANANIMIFPSEDIRTATNNFSQSNKIGTGGSGEVFKGRLGHISVAVKRFSSEHVAKGLNLMSEVAMLTKYRHPHLIILFGHTNLSDPQPCLVYPLMTQGNVRDRLDQVNDMEVLSWDIRTKVAYQAALALAFLHKPYPNAPDMLLHLDFKSENILLDQQYEVRVADLGIAKYKSEFDGEVGTHRIGVSLGYTCPEYVQRGIVSEKNDVYAFGVVLAELLSGKKAAAPNLGKELRTRMPNAHDLLTTDFIDPLVKETWPQDQFRTLGQIARRCVDENPEVRPSMLVVCDELEKLVKREHRQCSACKDNPVNTRLQCGHAVVCSICAQYLRQVGMGCPLCRTRIARIDSGIFAKTYTPS